MTGLPPPTFLAAAPENQQQRRPGASLFPPRWLAANLAYLRDLDYLSSRTGAAREDDPEGREDQDWGDEAAENLPDQPPKGRQNRGSRGRRGRKRSPNGGARGD